MLLDIALTGLWLACILWASLKYTEHRQWWTLRLKVSCLIPGRGLILISTAGTLTALWKILEKYDARFLSVRILLGSLLTAFLFVFFCFLMPFGESRDYFDLRWKAWTGPSRTGIPPSLTRYIGNEQDWISMLSSCRAIPLHPVERFSSLLSAFAQGITQDPTSILNTRHAMDQEADAVWVPRSQDKTCVYAPFEPDQPISLLWGQHLGFRPRCSRGVISVPRNLLSFNPQLKNGVDGRPLCLAHGILARNKGLEPQKIVCNMRKKGSFRDFEENSVFWPRPSKTLRSFYQAELGRSFSGLGEDYVTAATELALLLADAGYATTYDWLDGYMEHQDQELNNEIAGLGATLEDLSRLYRGQYAAMLVSLSVHRPGIRIRPELTVFAALRRLEGVSDVPQWLSSNVLQERQIQEDALLGQRGQMLVQAVI
jgi:hypothetical protein